MNNRCKVRNQAPFGARPERLGHELLGLGRSYGPTNGPPTVEMLLSGLTTSRMSQLGAAPIGGTR